MPDRVVTVLGTRPEIIRTSRITPKLDKYCDHTIVYTNQNYTKSLRDIFFEDLGLRQPDVFFDARGTLAEQLVDMFPKVEKLFREKQPDKVFILGDTNSALCAIIAERMGIPVYHMEAGNRSFDRKIPEEVNRRLIDSISSYNLTYTQTSKKNLITDGCSDKNIFLSGNPTLEVLDYYKDRITGSILTQLNLGFPDSAYTQYCLADFHRTENVDDPFRLSQIIRGLNLIAERTQMPVICSIHPRTKSRLRECGQEFFTLHEDVRFLDAMGFFDFVGLEQYAQVIITDSGLVSEEACLLHVPCVILRDTTERPEVVETGAAMISGIDAERMVDCVQRMKDIDRKWRIPRGFDDLNVSDKVVNFVLGERQ